VGGGPLNTIGALSVVGEVAFLDGGPRSATLVGVTGGECLRLTRERFEMLSGREPLLGQAIVLDLARLVTRRLRAASDVIAQGGT
jgi:CRP-like cAMP-binding protein